MSEIQPMSIRQKILNALWRAQEERERATLGSLNQRLADRKPEWFPVVQQMEQDGEIIPVLNPDRRDSIWLIPSHILHAKYDEDHRRMCAYLSELENPNWQAWERTHLTASGGEVISEWLSGQAAYEYLHNEIIDKVTYFEWISYPGAKKALLQFPIKEKDFTFFWSRMTHRFYAEHWYTNSLRDNNELGGKFTLHANHPEKPLWGSPTQMAISALGQLYQNNYEQSLDAIEQIVKDGGFSPKIITSAMTPPEIDDSVRATKAEAAGADIDDPCLLVFNKGANFVSVMRDLLEETGEPEFHAEIEDTWAQEEEDAGSWGSQG